MTIRVSRRLCASGGLLNERGGDMQSEQSNTCAYCVKSIGFLDLVCTVHLRSVGKADPACVYFSNVIQFSQKKKAA